MDLIIWRVCARARAAEETVNCYGVCGVTLTKCFCGCRGRRRVTGGWTESHWSREKSDEASLEPVQFACLRHSRASVQSEGHRTARPNSRFSSAAFPSAHFRTERSKLSEDKAFCLFVLCWFFLFVFCYWTSKQGAPSSHWSSCWELPPKGGGKTNEQTEKDGG